jgi:hypothetical protein
MAILQTIETSCSAGLGWFDILLSLPLWWKRLEQSMDRCIGGLPQVSLRQHPSKIGMV